MSVRHPRCRRCRTVKFLLPPTIRRLDCNCKTLLDGICLKQEFQEEEKELPPSARSCNAKKIGTRVVINTEARV